jgi:ribosome-associated translation inhibitor RaiA
MQTPLQITLRNMDYSEALDARIRARAEKLETLYPRIMSCQVVVERLSSSHQSGNDYLVRIDLRVPGHDIAINRERDEDVYVAVRNAFDSATRRLAGLVPDRRVPSPAEE